MEFDGRLMNLNLSQKEKRVLRLQEMENWADLSISSSVFKQIVRVLKVTRNGTDMEKKSIVKGVVQYLDKLYEIENDELDSCLATLSGILPRFIDVVIQTSKILFELLSGESRPLQTAQHFGSIIAFFIHELCRQEEMYILRFRKLWHFYLEGFELSDVGYSWFWHYHILCAGPMEKILEAAYGAPVQQTDDLAQSIARASLLICDGMETCGDFETQYSLAFLLIFWLQEYATVDDKNGILDRVFLYLPDKAMRLILRSKTNRDIVYKTRFFLKALNKANVAQNSSRIITLFPDEIKVGPHHIQPAVHPSMTSHWVSFSKGSRRIHAFISFQSPLIQEDWEVDDWLNLSISKSQIKSYSLLPILKAHPLIYVLHLKLYQGFGSLFDGYAVPATLVNETSVYFRFSDFFGLQEAMDLIQSVQDYPRSSEETEPIDEETMPTPPTIEDKVMDSPNGENETENMVEIVDLEEGEVDTRPWKGCWQKMENLNKKIATLGLDIYDVGIYDEDSFNIRRKYYKK